MLIRSSRSSIASRTLVAISRAFLHSSKEKHAGTSCFSIREGKDPKRFQDMEHARRYLTSQASGPSLPGFIQWLSESPGSTVGRLYTLLVTNIGEGHVQKRSQVSEKDYVSNAFDLERLEVLTLLERSVVARIARRFPHVLELSDSEIVARLILLKSLFRGCDCSVLIERAPSYLLCTEETLRRMADMMALLQASLAGADIVSMVHDDPELLQLDIHHGIEQFKQLWDVDEKVLADSDPAELALAVRHLCAAGKGRQGPQ